MDYQDEVDALEHNFEDTPYKRTRAKTSQRFCFAPDKTDGRFNEREKALRVFYACMGGPADDRTAHMTGGDAWDMLHRITARSGEAVGVQGLRQAVPSENGRHDGAVVQKVQQTIERLTPPRTTSTT